MLTGNDSACHCAATVFIIQFLQCSEKVTDSHVHDGLLPEGCKASAEVVTCSLGKK